MVILAQAEQKHMAYLDSGASVIMFKIEYGVVESSY